MNYELAFSYIFKDPHWVKKFLIGIAFYITGIFIFPLFFVWGYHLRIIRQVAEGEQEGLPEWNNFGELFRSGFTIAAIFLIYFLPVIAWASVFLLFIIALSEDIFVPLIFTVFFGFEILIMIWSLFIAIISPVLVIRYATTRRFRSAFQFGNMYNFIKTIPGPYFLVVLLAYGIGMVASFGWVLLLIGILFTTFYSGLVTAHLQGQLYFCFIQKSRAL